VASALDAADLGPDAKTALYMYNGNEYMEAQYGCMKTRGVPINVNYRYLDEELWYLLDNSDSEALFFHSSLGDRVARVIDRIPNLKLLVEVDDGEGAGQVERALAYAALIADNEPTERIERAEDDIYMLYTGGTTGMPKGVMYASGGMAAGLIASGFPLLGVAPPTDAAAVAGIVKTAVEARQSADLDTVRAADARDRAVDRPLHPPPRRRTCDHAHQPQPRCARGARHRRAPSGLCRHHRR